MTLLFNERLEEGDRGFGVSELQYLLAVVAEFNNSVRQVRIDGIFGPATTAAVRDFQYDYGIPADGIVGQQTWRALYDTYRNLLESLPENYFAASTRPYPGSPLRIGAAGQDVSVLQTYLNRVSDVYTSIPKLTVDGVYGQSTAGAVRAFQRIFGLEETGVTGSATWESIAEEYRTLVDGQYGSSTQFGGPIS